MIRKISLLTLMCLFVTSIHALTYQDANGITWTFSVATYDSHTGAYLSDMTGNSENVTVPYSVSDGTNEYDVLWLGNPANSYSSTNPFYNKSTITSITLPETLLGICSSAFYGCTSLQNVNIPSGIKSIPYRAFYLCMNLKSISIPSSVESLYGDSFAGCFSIESVNIEDSDKPLLINGGVNFNYNSYTYSGGIFYCSRETLKKVHIGRNLQNKNSYDRSPFYNCSQISDLTFGDDVTIIPDESFYGENGYVTTIKFPKNLKYIGKYAFRGFKSLKVLDFPEGLDSIGSSAFWLCDKVRIVNIPTTLKAIRGSFPYARIVNIKDLTAWCRIDFDDYSSNPLHGSTIDLSTTPCLILNGKFLTEIIIPDDITEIKPYAFQSYQHLKSIVLPSSVKKVGKEAFNECVALKYVDIGDGVTHLDEHAFSNCYYMEEFNIGSALESADQYAIINYWTYKDQTTNFKYLKVRATKPPKMTDLAYMPVEKSILYVPKGCLQAYRNDTIWGKFTTIKEYEDSAATQPMLTIHNSTKGDIAVSVKKNCSYLLKIEVPEGKKLISVTYNNIDVTDKISKENTYMTPSITCDSEISINIQ